MIDTRSLQHEPVAFPERSLGRVIRSVAGYALLVALMFVSPLFVFIPAALFACGIRNGRRAALVVLSLATLFASLIAVQSGRAPGATQADALMGYGYLAALALAIGVPALAVAPMVERGEAFGRVLMSAVLLGIGGLTITEAGMRSLAQFSPYAEQVKRAHETSTQLATAYAKAGMNAEMVSVVKRWMDIGIACLPGFFLMDIIVVFVLSLVMFGRLRAWRDFVDRRSAAGARALYRFRNLSLPDWLLFLFVIGGLTPLVTGMLQTIAANVLAVVSFLYLLQGLAIFRSLLSSVGAGAIGTLFSYLMLGFLTITGIAPLLLSIAGLFDSFFDFRHFRRKDHSDESHPH